MMFTAVSRGGIPIRLPDERWAHIAGDHGELSGMQADVVHTVSAPDRVLAGNEGALLAVRELAPNKWLVVVYREAEGDGFVITAHLTRRSRSLAKRKQLWP